MSKITKYLQMNKIELMHKVLWYGKREFLGRFLQGCRRLKYRMLSNNYYLVGKPIIYQPLLISGTGNIVFGKNVKFGVINSFGYYSQYGYLETKTKEAKITFGSNTWINNNCSFICNASHISIGDNCLIGNNISVYDSDFHALNAAERTLNSGKSVPVYIGNNVFIGSNVTILKGSYIGHNSVIGAGSVVSGQIPDNVIAAGNPCKVLRHL